MSSRTNLIDRSAERDVCRSGFVADAQARVPRKKGLYDPAYEHDACGVAFVARLSGVASHTTVEWALRALANLEHRGAAGADPGSGDGAGIDQSAPGRSRSHTK